MQSEPSNKPACYLIGDLVIDTGTRRVLRDGKTLKLGGLTFDLFQALVECAPNVATHDEIAKQVWKGRPVAPETIAQRAKMLRVALSDDAKNPHYFEPVRGHGYRLCCAVEPVRLALPEARKRTRSLSPLLALSAVVTIALAVIWLLPDDRIPNSIAVMPFENLGASEGEPDFATFLHEEVLNQLQRIQLLNVIGGTTMQRYRNSDKPLPVIAEELNVETLVQASVRYANDRIRVTALLHDGATGVQLWSQTYDRDLVDVFAIESDIAISVASEMAVVVTDDERARIEAVPTTNRDAVYLYNKARAARELQTLEGAEECLEPIDRAVAFDSGFVEGWVEKSWCHSWRMVMMPEHKDRERTAAMDALSRARRIDSSNPAIYPSLAMLAASAAEWTDAANFYRRARELGENTDRFSTPFTSAVGFLSDTRRAAQWVFDRNPYESTNALFLMSATEALGEARAADAVYVRGKSLYTEWPAGDFARSVILLGRGTDAALDELSGIYAPGMDPYMSLFGISFGEVDPQVAIESVRARFDSDPTDDSVVQLFVAAAAAWYEEPELALSALESVIDRFAIDASNLWMPLFFDVRQLDGFKALVREKGLEEFWRRNGWPDLCEPVGLNDFRCL